MSARTDGLLALVVVLVPVLYFTNPLGFTPDEVAKKLLFFVGFPLLLAAIVFVFSEAVVRLQRMRERNQLEKGLEEVRIKAEELYRAGSRDLLQLYGEGREALEKGDRDKARGVIEAINNVYKPGYGQQRTGRFADRVMRD